MNVDAILFDLDGTLWNATEGIRISWNQVISRYPGLRAPMCQAEVEGIMGLQMDVIARRTFPGLPEKQQIALLEECEREEDVYLTRHGAKLYDRILETLEVLHQHYDLCIVSNCQLGYIDTFLKSSHAEHLFRDNICFGDTGVRKGESMRILCERNGYQKTVYVGDTQGDCDEARYAGIPFIYAAYGFGDVKSCDDRIEKPEELLNMFEKTRR